MQASRLPPAACSSGIVASCPPPRGDFRFPGTRPPWRITQMKYTWLVTLSMMFALLVTTGPVAFADDEKPSDSAATQSDTEEKKEDAKKDKEEESDQKDAKK